MPTSTNQFFFLEHYLRLVTRKPESWLSALQVLTGSPRLAQEVSTDSGQGDFNARLAFFSTRNISLCGVYLDSASKLVGVNADTTAIFMPLQGTAEFVVNGQPFFCSPGVPFVLEPNVEFRADLSPIAHLFIIQIACPESSESGVAFQNGDRELAKIVERYLAATPFFRDYEHAVRRALSLERALVSHRKGGDSNAPGLGPKPLVGDDDRRLCRALHMINDGLEVDIDLASIARDSGLSLRNLYYLMKKYTRMTPHGFCRSRRLIKVRESMICNYAEDPVVANHALKWGFNHLGRFSSYYQQYFGEYPSETIKHLKDLIKSSDDVLSVKPHPLLPQAAWYTSQYQPPEMKSCASPQ